MPPLESMGRHQKAVLWEVDGVDRYGELKKLPPVDVNVRWEEGERDMLKADATAVNIIGTVTANRTIPIGSIIWLAPSQASSALAQWYALGSAGDDSGLMMVQTTDSGMDLKGRQWRYEFGMVKYRDTLPESA